MVLSDTDRREESRLLMEAERDRAQIPGSSRRWPDITLEDSYAIADVGIQTKVSAGAKIRGKKIGLTSRAMQRSSQIDEPDFGTLLDTMFIEDGGTAMIDRYCVPRVELELAFILGDRLEGPGVELHDALRATEFVVPSIEIIDARAQDPRTIFDTVADNGAAAGVVLGGRPVDPIQTDLRWVGAMMYRNAEIEETGLAAGVLGHPGRAVAWLANKSAEFGTSLEPGEVILTGSFTRPVWAQKGDTLLGDFGDLGTVSVRFV